MASKSVTVGCRLPHGIIIEHPMDPSKKVTLIGPNKSRIIGATFGTTEVDGAFWEQWEAANKEFPAFKSKAIFVAKTSGDAIALGDELKGERTGFEPMQTDGKDPRAAGVKTVAKTDE